MTEPFSRIVRVDALPRDGQTFEIEASDSEREALALSYKLPAIQALVATLRVHPTSGGGAEVTGHVHGELTQTCVVSLDPFPGTVDEEVDVRFAPIDEKSPARRPPDEPLTVSMDEEDDPDPLINGRIDLGALTAEFFALGLDPYPRKPGVTFEPPAEENNVSPFAVLRDKASDDQGGL